jgi:hypothetical protein
MAKEWAKCDECGGEVIFPAYVTYSGELDFVQETDEGMCPECGVDFYNCYTVVTEEQEV